MYPSKVVKNLGTYLDQHLSMDHQMKNVCKSLNIQIYKIAKIRDFLNTDVTKTLITSLILSKIDYCNSLLLNLPSDKIDKLQCVQNNAASRLIFRRKKRDHVTLTAVERASLASYKIQNIVQSTCHLL